MVHQTYRPTAADKKPAPPTKPAKAGIAQPEKAAMKVGFPVSAASSLAKTLRWSGFADRLAGVDVKSKRSVSEYVR